MNLYKQLTELGVEVQRELMDEARTGVVRRAEGNHDYFTYMTNDSLTTAYQFASLATQLGQKERVVETRNKFLDTVTQLRDHRASLLVPRVLAITSSLFNHSEYRVLLACLELSYRSGSLTNVTTLSQLAGLSSVQRSMVRECLERLGGVSGIRVNISGKYPASSVTVEIEPRELSWSMLLNTKDASKYMLLTGSRLELDTTRLDWLAMSSAFMRMLRARAHVVTRDLLAENGMLPFNSTVSIVYASPRIESLLFSSGDFWPRTGMHKLTGEYSQRPFAHFDFTKPITGMGEFVLSDLIFHVGYTAQVRSASAGSSLQCETPYGSHFVGADNMIGDQKYIDPSGFMWFALPEFRKYVDQRDWELFLFYPHIFTKGDVPRKAAQVGWARSVYYKKKRAVTRLAKVVPKNLAKHYELLDSLYEVGNGLPAHRVRDRVEVPQTDDGFIHKTARRRPEIKLESDEVRVYRDLNTPPTKRANNSEPIDEDFVRERL